MPSPNFRKLRISSCGVLHTPDNSSSTRPSKSSIEPFEEMYSNMIRLLLKQDEIPVHNHFSGFAWVLLSDRQRSVRARRKYRFIKVENFASNAKLLICIHAIYGPVANMRVATLFKIKFAAPRYLCRFSCWPYPLTA